MKFVIFAALLAIASAAVGDACADDSECEAGEVCGASSECEAAPAEEAEEEIEAVAFECTMDGYVGLVQELMNVLLVGLSLLK